MHNQLPSHWLLPNGKGSWSQQLVPLGGCWVSQTVHLKSLLSPPCAVLCPCWFWPDCPALPYFSAAQFQAVISSGTLARQWSLIAKWPSIRLFAKSLFAHKPSRHPDFGLLDPKCSPSSSSLFNHPHIRCQGCSSSLFFGKNKNLNAVVWISHLFFPIISFSRPGQLYISPKFQLFSLLVVCSGDAINLSAFTCSLCNLHCVSPFKFLSVLPPHEWSQDTSTFTS